MQDFKKKILGHQFSFDLLKGLTVVLLASASSVSIAIIEILFNKLNDESISKEQKIIEPLMAYLTISIFRTWLIWNFIGQRLNGQVDNSIDNPDETFVDTPGRVLIAYIGNVPSFSNAFLATQAVFPHVAISITMGLLNYTTNLYTEVMPAFRKHTESQKSIGQNIKPFFNQKYVYYLGQHAIKIAVLIRELLPIIRGLICIRATSNNINYNLSSFCPRNILLILNVFLSLMIYESAAYSTHFELCQLRDNLTLNVEHFEIETYLSNSSNAPVAILAKAINGILFIELLQKLNISKKTAVNITLFFSAVGMIALIQEIFQNYISSSSHDIDKGFLMKYVLGHDKAQEVSYKLEIVLLSLSIILGSASTFIKAASLQAYVKESNFRIFPGEGNADVQVYSNA